MVRVLVGAYAVALLSSTAHAAQRLPFTTQLEPAGSDQGRFSNRFDSVLTGQLISGLSNIHVYLDGSAFSGNRAVQAGSDNPASLERQTGGALTLPDGAQHNVLFVDIDNPGAFGSIAPLADAVARPDPTGRSAFRLTRIASRPQLMPEPAGWGMMVGGLALAGAAMRRERRKAAARRG